MQEPVELKNTILFALINYLQLADIDQKLLDTGIAREIEGKLVLPVRRLDEFYCRHKAREERDRKEHSNEEDHNNKGLPILTLRGAQSVAMSFDLYLRRQEHSRVHESGVFVIPNSDYAVEVVANPRKPVAPDIFASDQDALREQIKFISILNHLTQAGKENLFNKFLGFPDLIYYVAIRKVREIYRDKDGQGQNDVLVMGDKPTAATFDLFRERLREVIKQMTPQYPFVPQDDKVFIGRLKGDVDNFVALNDLMIELLHQAMDRASISREDANILLFLQQVGVGVVSEEVARDIKAQTYYVSLGAYKYGLQFNPGRAKRSGQFKEARVGRQPESIVSESYVRDFLPLQRHLRADNPRDGIWVRELANPYPHRRGSKNSVYDPIQGQVVNVADLESQLRILRENTPPGEPSRYRAFFNGPFAGYTISHLHYQGFLGETVMEVALQQDEALEFLGIDQNQVRHYKVNRRFFENKAGFPLRSTLLVEGREPEGVAQAVMEVLKHANQDSSLPITGKSRFTYNLLLCDDDDFARVYIMIKRLVLNRFSPEGLTEPNVLVFSNEGALKGEVEELKKQLESVSSSLEKLRVGREEDKSKNGVHGEAGNRVGPNADLLRKEYDRLVSEGVSKGIVLYEGRPATVEMADLLIFGKPSHGTVFRKIMENSTLQRWVIDEVFRQCEYPQESFEALVANVVKSLSKAMAGYVPAERKVGQEMVGPTEAAQSLLLAGDVRAQESAAPLKLRPDGRVRGRVRHIRARKSAAP